MMALRLNEVMRKVRGRLARDECAGATDAALLERFRSSRDEEAFTELVRRHGGMVFGVCRRLLPNSHDAEDAFQATFLVLVRSGSAVRQLASVASWLYGVARRTALEARRAAARRKVKEAGAMRGSAVSTDSCDDLREVLDEEIGRLPEKFRAPLVLCDLEGKTRREAAKHLGCPEGTVASRLAMARKTLGSRLARRGVTVPAGMITAVVGGEAASAAVPPALIGSTVRVAVGRAVVPSGVAPLVKGVLTTMLLKKLKSGMVLALAAAVLAAGGNVFRGAFGGEAQAADESKARSPLEALRHENELLRVNLNVLLEKVRSQEAELQAMKVREGTSFQFTKVVPDNTKAALDIIVEKRADTQAKGAKGERRPAIELKTDAPRTVTAPGAGQAVFDVQVLKTESAEKVGDALYGFIVVADPIQRVELALKGLRGAGNEKARLQAIRDLETALDALKAHREQKTKSDPAP
jgi:RNA polymerase sigma factor (sigma-70 family)